MKQELLKHFDTKEVIFPETLFIRDIENKVFQSLCLQCLTQIEGVAPLEASIFDSFLGRDSMDVTKGITIEQDQDKHSVHIKLEVNIAYGMSIPAKAEEIQNLLLKEISSITGLHVASIHVIFKNLILPKKVSLLEPQVSR